MDDFSALQLFEGATNKTAVFIMQKGQPQRYPVSYAYWQKKTSGRKGSFDYDATLEEVIEKTERRSWEAEPADDADSTSAWLTGARGVLKHVKKLLGKSDYVAHAGVYTGGANAVYWFEILKDHGDGTVTARNITKGAKRKIESVQVRLESEYLHPLLKGQDVDAWKPKPSAFLLFVQDVKTRRGLAKEQLKNTFALKWLELHEKLLRERAAFKRYYRNDCDPFWSMFDVGDYTVKPWKVVWSRIAWKLEAAVVGKIRGKVVLPQETFSFVGLDDEIEAHYACGVLNSTPFRFAVSCFSQPGSKSFGTPSILEKARIPKFDPASKLHRQIAAEARRLAGGTADASEPVHETLDALCAQLWGVDAAGLRAIQSAYRDLYVTAPEERSLAGAATSDE